MWQADTNIVLGTRVLNGGRSKKNVCQKRHELSKQCRAFLDVSFGAKEQVSKEQVSTSQAQR